MLPYGELMLKGMKSPQLPGNTYTSVTNMAEYLAAQVIEGHELPILLTRVEHYPEHGGETGEWSLVR